MSKQNFCLSKGLKSNFIFILSAAAIMLFGFLVILPTAPEKTFAEGDDPNEGIVITISPEINANLISSENGDYKIVKDTVTVGTDALNGYTLYISTDTPEHQTLYLNGDTSSENRINGANGTYEDPKTLGDYEWGFAIPGVGHFDDAYSAESPSAESKFAILPTESKIIRDYTTAVSEDAAEVYYGFKLGGTIEPGEYETNITYTAIPATQPLMAKAIFGGNNNLNFVYDRNTYYRGNIYTDNLGTTTVSDVFYVPTGTETTPTWNTVSWLTRSINFAPSFYDFKPTSTADWFSNLMNIQSVTNTNNLNTSHVTDMNHMFHLAGFNATNFTADFSSWDTSNVTNMSHMFSGIVSGPTVNGKVELNLGRWNTSKVTDMSYMFSQVGASATECNISGLDGWDTSNVTNMTSMFQNTGSGITTSFNLNLSGWDISKANADYMFAYMGKQSVAINLNLSGWKPNNITQEIFAGIGGDATSYLNLDFSGWNLEGKTSTYRWFENLGNNYNLSHFSLNLSNWKNMTSIVDMKDMFLNTGYKADDWSLNLDGWDTGSVTDMREMFLSAGQNATTWNISDLSGWDTSNVIDMSLMFYNAGYNATTWDVGYIRNWDVRKVRDRWVFINSRQTNIDISRLPWQSGF